MKIGELIRDLLDFLKNPLRKIYETYEWVREVFTNWDSEVYDFVDQLKILIFQAGVMLRKITDKLKYLLHELGNMVKLFTNSLRGWK